MLSVRSVVWRRVANPRPPVTVTASDLLAYPEAGRSGLGSDGDLAIPPGILDDLYHPRLVITDGYVGPDRRPVDRGRRHTRRRGEPGRRMGRLRSESSPVGPDGAPEHRMNVVLATVAATTAAVAPLTLVIAHLAAH